MEEVSKTGGHLASNLGAVELTVAIHRVFDTARDRLVFDVGHQFYPHKMITGRREAMSTLRQYGGIAGFPKPGESGHDAFIAGHASNSVAVALGMARARTAMKEDYKVLALIGDGADVYKRQAFQGPVVPQVPASVLQLHPNVVLVGDRGALSKLDLEKTELK